MMKRVIDVAAAAIILVLLSPVLAAVAVAVWVNLGFPILFRQQRPGLNGEPFTLYKFRTMSRANEPEPSCALDEVRLTRFGRWLRRTSLDELPELWNVLRGDMSLVGPRPLLMRYLALYTEEQMRRHEVRPGLTGWAQVNGRNAVDWEEKFELDLWYVDNSSLLLDTKILLLTVRALLKRQGISHQNSATMPEFRGSPRSQMDRNESARHKSLD
jgi:lipopolysaccharide/colanic/teichoic acid biosynthesis glycosyltransferase